MHLRDISRPLAAKLRAGSGCTLPKVPDFCRVFFPIVFAAVLTLGTSATNAQSYASPKPEQPAAAQPATAAPNEAPKTAAEAPKPTDAARVAEKPATATTPAVPAPGATTPASEPGAPVPASGAAAGPDAKPVQGTGSALLPHDLSPYGMFMNADVVVKAVMIGLAFASLVTWTILLVKLIELFGARSRAQSSLTQLANAQTLGDAVAQLDKPSAPVTRLARAALAEAERSHGLPPEGIKERATALLARIESRAGRAMGRGTGLLATIGSTAPFVGLFGTVWGIMNSFIGISKTNTTNLAVVAPGIAEALLATAFGLVAAIPAVIIYNMFARNITGYRSLLGDASTEVLRLLSRDLDRAGGTEGVVPLARRAAE